VKRFDVVPQRSTVLIGARSTMGPITFESRALTGRIDAVMLDGAVCADPFPRATLEVDLTQLRSGNELYDAELRRRIDTRRFPTCTLDLHRTARLGDRRYSLSGDLTFHDTTRTLEGSAEVDIVDEHRLTVIGDKTIDIRDFDVPAPSILLLKIYPEVRVQIFVEAVAEGPT
jgi:polyisoprenoid-binding protein YceI